MKTKPKAHAVIQECDRLICSCDEIDTNQFPTTRYRGSKRKLLPWIYASLKDLSFATALDVFGGSATVSYLFKKMGKDVTYNDILRFNHRIGRAIIANDSTTIDPSELATILSRKLNSARSRTISKYFNGYYFTDYENRWLDDVVSNIDSWAGDFPSSSFKRDIAYYALFQTCLAKRPFNLFHRKNLYLRHADVTRSFGNKTTWDRSIQKTFCQFIQEANELVFTGKYKCRAVNHDALSIPGKHYDLVYVDPPYLVPKNDNEAADYRRVYHFLEGLCHYKDWHRIIDFDTKNRRLLSKDVNSWIDKEKTAHALNALFEKYRSSIIVVSYKKHGTPSISSITRMLRRHGKRVTTKSINYSYALNHQNGEAKSNRECLIIGE